MYFFTLQSASDRRLRTSVLVETDEHARICIDHSDTQRVHFTPTGYIAIIKAVLRSYNEASDPNIVEGSTLRRYENK